MSQQVGEAGDEDAAAALLSAGSPLDAFAQIMDVLAPDEEGAPAGAGDDPAGRSADGDGSSGGSADGAGAAPGGAAGQPPAAAPADGAAGDDAARGDGGAAAGAAAGDGAAGQPGQPAGDLEPAARAAEIGKLSTTIEENLQKTYQQEALAAVREEHGQYFEAIQKHPRLLVGAQVPRIDGKEGMETLNSTQDARDWQEAVKQILGSEVRDRASRQLDENKDFLTTIHQSIDLFTSNPDLIPGTKGFNRELADSFVEFAEPYAVRVDGKLQGYSVPVQPLVDRLRAQLKERAAQTPQQPAAQKPGAAAGAPPAAGAPADAPQAGVTSKAGSSGDGAEDFSTLFGTIGLPNLRI